MPVQQNPAVPLFFRADELFIGGIIAKGFERNDLMEIHSIRISIGKGFFEQFDSLVLFTKPGRNVGHADGVLAMNV